MAASEVEAERAYDRVLYAVGNNHRGTYFPVVLDVVPFLGEIVEHGGRWACARALDVLIDLVGSFGPDSEVVTDGDIRPEDLPALLRSRVREFVPGIQTLAGDSSVAEIQQLARDLLECLASRE